MIRPVATLPPGERARLDSAPVADEHSMGDGSDGRARQPLWFVLVEVLLVVLVPVLAYVGSQELLDSRAGTFTTLAGPTDPGWRAIVEPTPVTVVAELVDGRLSGLAVITQPGSGEGGGAVILVSPETLLADGRTLSSLGADEAIDAVGATMRLGITTRMIVDRADWSSVLGDRRYSIDNPDPVPGDGVQPAIPVGVVTIDASTTAGFLGNSTADDDPRSLVFRRRLWWEAALADPPAGDHPLSVLLRQVGEGNGYVVDLPTEPTAIGLDPIDSAVEALVNEVVPLPSGSQPDDRITIRVVDRSGTLDTRAIALELGRRGFEVTEIANAAVFDDGPTQLLVPIDRASDSLRDLAVSFGAATVSPDPIEETGDDTVVLLAGSDIVLE